ncbi:MAG: hypothetical protein QOF39_2749 [Frankiales bacterium]|nr:hypothetical protein [Frankiales bacterium]
MPAPHLDGASTRRRLTPRLRRMLVGATALTTALTTAGGFAGSPAAHASPLDAFSSSHPDLGANVIVFDPTEDQATIQAQLDAISAQQVPNQFGQERYSLLFKPGTYGSAANPLVFQVGFYTEVAGLGQNPGDVTINGLIDVYNQCFGPVDPNATYPEHNMGTNCVALDNFWRSMSNLTINATGGTGCYSSNEMWAVSQAAPVRRVQVNGFTTLFDYCGDQNYSSGGFIADSNLPGGTLNGSQQQFLTENSVLGTVWTNGVWNQVFAGDTGSAVPAQSFPTPPYTTLATDPVSRDKPYLYLDASGNENVFVPDARTSSVGPSWQGGTTPGTAIPIKKFYVAHPSDPAWKLNTALLLGQNLLFTPGVYHLDQALRVWRPDTVVLGMGFATLIPTRGNAAIQVASVPGVKLAGLLIDAGTVKSATLVQVGNRFDDDLPARVRDRLSSASDPTTLSDVFVRVGGDIAGKTETAVTINSDNVLLDDMWIWRADHGDPGTVGWTVNTANQGLIVNGDNVTATGLFVEHFQKYEVTWNGEGGRVVMFQNEMPYDPPNQAAWQHDGVLGYAAIHVDKHVKTFEGWGLGSYIFTNVDPTIHASNAFEVPVAPGVKLHDILTVSLAAGTIDHIVNGVGAPALPNDGVIPHDLVSYP